MSQHMSQKHYEFYSVIFVLAGLLRLQFFKVAEVELQQRGKVHQSRTQHKLSEDVK